MVALKEQKGTLLLLGDSESRNGIITDACKKTNTDLYISNIDVTFSGTTLNSVLISKNMVVCANIGDSRAIIASRETDLNGVTKWFARAISHDHKPDAPQEYQRIINSQGRVESYLDEKGNPMGPKRVWKKDQNLPGLAMSRALGDKSASEAGVICTPEIIQETLRESDKALIMGSDGIWEHLPNEKVAQIVGEYYEKNDVVAACEKLTKEAVKEWEEKAGGEVVDDITAIVVFFN